MSQRTILVTGSNGQLGSELRDLGNSLPGYEFVFFDRASLPIQDSAASRKIIEHYRPSHLINAAAYTQVDKAESEIDQANLINGEAVGNLASLCGEFNSRFIHVSTDYVFNGNATNPIKEDDPVEPVNAYGYSKLLGEKLTLQNNPSSVIIRTSWVYSAYGKNFVKTMIRLMNEKESINVVKDQVGSPTYAADLAAAIIKIISNQKWIPGIFHFSNRGIISWFDFATEIRNQIGSSCKVNAIPTSHYPTPARRPMYSVLDTNKIEKTYGVAIKDWKDSLKICISKLSRI